MKNTMADERWAPASCLLPGGRRALIAGGYSYAKRECVATISLFDATARRFYASRARLPYPADFVLAAPLPDGVVLLTGGFNDVWGSLDSAALYEPKQDICVPLAHRMHDRRELAQATCLADGSVLITGGLSLDAGTTLSSAELYEPAEQRFVSTTAPLRQDRFGHAACRLADGRVLIVGGTHWNMRRRDSRALASAEIYDPAQGTFHACTGALLAARDRPTATLLPNGKVLIAGGQGANGQAVKFAELFDPANERFSRIAGEPLTPRMAHSAVQLPSGDVLLYGGWDADAHSTTASCVVYDWQSGAFAMGPEMPFATHDVSLLAFPNGLILAAGGKIAHGTASGANSKGAVLQASTLPQP